MKKNAIQWHKEKNDEWVDGYTTAAISIGVWGVFMGIVGTLLNHLTIEQHES